MSTILKMPSFSVTMEAGKLLSWLVAPGDVVAKGQVLAEIETDKAVSSLEAPEAGEIVELLVPAGDDDVPVNAGIALIRFQGESLAAAPAVAGMTTVAGPPAAPTEVVNGPESRQRVRASPAARAIARQQGIDLHRVTATGPSGRIVRTDLDRAAPTETGLTATPEAGRIAGDQKGPGRPAQLRLALARALVHAKATVPHFYADLDVCVDNLMSLRREIAATDASHRSPTITAYLIRAAALALREIPSVNRWWSVDGIQQRSACHIGCAVGLPGRVALPVVRNADRMTVQQVGQDLLRLSSLARSEVLTQHDMGDASLTISNLGMHGIDRFFPIINVPEALILGIGQARRVVGVVDDLIAVRTMMSCTASVDHRVIDGELLGRFMQAFRRYIETPQQLGC